VKEMTSHFPQKWLQQHCVYGIIWLLGTVQTGQKVEVLWKL